MSIFNGDWLMVTPSTLFSKQDYKELSLEEQWIKAVNEGWRFDMHLNKFYKWSESI